MHQEQVGRHSVCSRPLELWLTSMTRSRRVQYSPETPVHWAVTDIHDTLKKGPIFTWNTCTLNCDWHPWHAQEGCNIHLKHLYVELWLTPRTRSRRVQYSPETPVRCAVTDTKNSFEKRAIFSWNTFTVSMDQLIVWFSNTDIIFRMITSGLFIFWLSFFIYRATVFAPLNHNILI